MERENQLDRLKIQQNESVKKREREKEGVEDEIIYLNVGGKKFTTTRTTLLSQPSIFQQLLSGKFELLRDKKGRIFLDWDPFWFDVILFWFRSGEWVLNSDHQNYKEMQRLNQTLKYFGISGKFQELTGLYVEK